MWGMVGARFPLAGGEAKRASGGLVVARKLMRHRDCSYIVGYDGFQILIGREQGEEDREGIW
jgi:hypothetical protein